MIRITLKTTKGELKVISAKVAEASKEKVIRVLKYVGERAVNEARSVTKTNDWTDRTGNLRSSIGYAIAENGSILDLNGFQQVKETADQGVMRGEALARKIAHETNGLSLIVVAGMNYACYVVDSGKNVLDSSQILATNAVCVMHQ